mmetsp:Transcript_46284/g.148207  ORF Transcript_46284/g.148207 Transcript_46284/m.148207 type:complete len:235 (-) Transcript_46284:788-1492(-)
MGTCAVWSKRAALTPSPNSAPCQSKPHELSMNVSAFASNCNVGFELGARRCARRSHLVRCATSSAVLALSEARSQDATRGTLDATSSLTLASVHTWHTPLPLYPGGNGGEARLRKLTAREQVVTSSASSSASPSCAHRIRHRARHARAVTKSSVDTNDPAGTSPLDAASALNLFRMDFVSATAHTDGPAIFGMTPANAGGAGGAPAAGTCTLKFSGAGSKVALPSPSPLSASSL